MSVIGYQLSLQDSRLDKILQHECGRQRNHEEKQKICRIHNNQRRGMRTRWLGCQERGKKG